MPALTTSQRVALGVQLLLEQRGIRLRLEQPEAGGEAVAQHDDLRLPESSGSAPPGRQARRAAAAARRVLRRRRRPRLQAASTSRHAAEALGEVDVAFGREHESLL